MTHPLDGSSVSLRAMRPSDAETFAAWGEDREFCEAAGWNPDLSRETRFNSWRALIADQPPGLLRLMADLGGHIVGFADLNGLEPHRRELGFLVGSRNDWGRGLGTAIARAGLAYGLDTLGLSEIWAEAADANAPSVAILRRLGMSETGRGDDVEFMGRRTFYRRFRALRRDGS